MVVFLFLNLAINSAARCLRKMSAFLQNEAQELNINAEYGYSVREFSKVPHVYMSDNYKSCLILSYQQGKNIAHRKDDYRNHFTLFRSDTSIIVVRTETTLEHADNDAVLEYDVITPSPDIFDRYRSRYESWCISFDKITYSGHRPDTFVDYTMIGSGEWWFYDNGIILNGKSGYTPNERCQSIFIYYELHVDHKITVPAKQPLFAMPPIIEVVLKVANPSAANRPTTSTAPPAAPPTPQRDAQPPSDPLGPPDLSSLSQMMSSSIPPNFLSSINSAARPLIQQNDTQQNFAKDIINKSVIPSLYWFNTRSQELRTGSIEYFKPKDFNCTTLQKFNAQSSVGFNFPTAFSNNTPEWLVPR